MNNELCEACENGNLEFVKYLCFTGCSNKNAIIYASKYGKLDIVEYFVNLDQPHPNDVISDFMKQQLSTKYNDAMTCAGQSGNLDLIKFFTNLGYKPNIGALICSCYYGHLNIVKYLINNYFDVSCELNVSIRMASQGNQIEIVKYLYLNGADINCIEEEMKPEILNWINKYKIIFDKCLAEIYGHPDLERTKSENQTFYQKNFSTT